MRLPERFVAAMLPLLGNDAFPALERALSEPRTWGLRVNTLKLPVKSYLHRTRVDLAPVRWSRDGFRHGPDDAPGKHPDYHAGLYYLQDPSAMLPAELLDPSPGEAVLDLCAAPGGKTAQLAAMMRNRGILVANDISPKRVKPLARNLQGLGVSCAAVLNESPDRLAAKLPAFFDKILLDVPCSGEGMFRKDDQAVKSWLKNGPESFVSLQRSILTEAWKMLKPGGRLVYSTCTFNPDENERNIAWAAEHLPGLRVVPVDAASWGLQSGRADWVFDAADRPMDGAGLIPGYDGNAVGHPDLSGAIRIWPHLAEGEGQFAALLEKEGMAPSSGEGMCPTHQQPEQPMGKSTERPMGESLESTWFQTAPADAIASWKAFQAAALSEDGTLIGSGRALSSIQDFILSGTLLYALPFQEGCFRNALPFLRAEMPGLFLGEWQHGRFEPSAALLHALEPAVPVRRLDFPVGATDVFRYLHGETLIQEGERGWTAVLAEGFPLGWGKQEDGFLKNRYPKGWRML